MGITTQFFQQNEHDESDEKDVDTESDETGNVVDQLDPRMDRRRHPTAFVVEQFSENPVDDGEKSGNSWNRSR